MKNIIRLEADVEVKELPELKIVSVDGVLYRVSNFNRADYSLEEVVKKILGDKDTEIEMPNKLEVFIPSDKYMYEQYRAKPTLCNASLVERWRKGLANDSHEDDYADPCDTICVDWRGMDGTFWLYHPVSGIFYPIPTVVELRYSNSYTVSSRKAFERAIRKHRRCEGTRWHQAYCEQCGGNTLIVRWRTSYKETATKEQCFCKKFQKAAALLKRVSKD
jgi:hypothetical protein